MKIIMDEGYQFGLGVFETIGIEQGCPLLLDMHLERMNHSLNVLGIEQTVSDKEVYGYLEGHSCVRGALKIIASQENKVFLLRGNPYVPEQYQNGFRLKFSKVLRNETSPLAGHKTLNYGDCILEKRRAGEEGADELIFFNTRGEICEGTATNIFFVRNGRIFTPKAACGLLPGVVRRFLTERFSVEEQVIRKEELCNMEECFATNSLMGIMPVVLLEEQKFSIGRVTEKCMQVYRKEVCGI